MRPPTSEVHETLVSVVGRLNDEHKLSCGPWPVKILTKRASFDCFGKVPIRGCNDADVRPQRARAAEALELAFLPDTQRLGLGGRRVQ